MPLLSDEMWRRHANQWSVYTRFMALPLAILAGWSRISIGWWAIIPIALVVVWLVLNPFMFKPIAAPSNWIEKGILGEQMWLKRDPLDRRHRDMLRVLVFAGASGLLIMVAGIIWLEATSAILGMALVVIAQLWRIRRYARLYDEAERDTATKPPTPAQPADSQVR